MAYEKQTDWENESYVNPTRMNHIEDGIYNNSEPTKETGTATNNITIDSSGYVKYVKKGKLVFVTYVFTVDDSSITSTSVLFSGLPAMDLVDGFFNWATMVNATTGASHRVRLLETGSLQNYYGKGLANGESYNGSFCYIAQ